MDVPQPVSATEWSVAKLKPRRNSDEVRDGCRCNAADVLDGAMQQCHRHNAITAVLFAIEWLGKMRETTIAPSTLPFQIEFSP